MVEKAVLVDRETAVKLLPEYAVRGADYKGIYVTEIGGQKAAVVKQEGEKYAVVPFSEKALRDSLIFFQRALAGAPYSALVSDEGLSFHRKLFKAAEKSSGIDEEARKFFNFHVLVHSYQRLYHEGKRHLEAIKEIVEAFPELTFDGLWDVKVESSYSIRDEAFKEELRETVERGRELEEKIREKGLLGGVFVVAYTSEGIRLSFSLRKAEEILEAVKRARECIHDGQIVVDRLIGNTFSEEDIDKMVELAESSDEMDFSP